MSESHNVNINLDDKSVEILKRVNALHRDSLINMGLALIEKTGYYKTMAGIEEKEKLEDVTSLDIDTIQEKQTEIKKEEPKAKSTTWDNF